MLKDLQNQIDEQKLHYGERDGEARAM